MWRCFTVLFDATHFFFHFSQSDYVAVHTVLVLRLTYFYLFAFPSLIASLLHCFIASLLNFLTRLHRALHCAAGRL